MENMTKSSGLVRITELAKQMRCGLYVDYGVDLETAFHAANALAAASREPAAVFTALYGVVNTLCNVIEEEANEKESDEQVQTDTHPCGQDADQERQDANTAAVG